MAAVGRQVSSDAPVTSSEQQPTPTQKATRSQNVSRRCNGILDQYPVFLSLDTVRLAPLTAICWSNQLIFSSYSSTVHWSYIGGNRIESPLKFCSNTSNLSTRIWPRPLCADLKRRELNFGFKDFCYLLNFLFLTGKSCLVSFYR